MIEAILIGQTIYTENGRHPWSLPGTVRHDPSCIIALGGNMFYAMRLPRKPTNRDRYLYLEAIWELQANTSGTIEIDEGTTHIMGYLS